MEILASLLSPLYQPLCFRVDFRSQRWDAPEAVVLAWLFVAVGADLAALWWFGQPAYYRMAGTLLIFLLIIAPPQVCGRRQRALCHTSRGECPALAHHAARDNPGARVARLRSDLWLASLVPGRVCAVVLELPSYAPKPVPPPGAACVTSIVF